MFKCDLHIHSICSDGRFTPSDIVKMAKEKNLDYVSLTDHDTLTGIKEALYEAEALNVKLIPGIELSTEYNGESIHILGFFNKDNYNNPELNTILNEFKEKRISRAYKIVDNLKKYHNIEIDINKVLSNGKDTIARPHIAKAIIDAGYPYDHDFIFDNFIGNNCPAYIPSTKLSTKKGIELLKKYNALVFLAHPVLVKKTPVKDILNLGFDGLEAIYYKNTEKDTEKFLKLAKDMNLFISSGSDCHGIPNDEGHGSVGDVNIPQDDSIISMLNWVLSYD
ncbi:PHP domain-containing protein [Clostridium tertium]|uniref:PHP domain-containing protein n=1 Tax=Clostridium tertium TaxID=1559 RepID=UPI00189F1E02|nr:PHP domain-containing protein [Clostridium tertium]MDB1948596.1 PHP domain-containing protein [Clostridium tertium]MDY4604291.1 PHP domain-containing protein [Clostridium tertium]